MDDPYGIAQKWMLEIQNLTFTDVEYTTDNTMFTVIESQNSLKVVLYNIHIMGEFLYSLNSSFVNDHGTGSINLKDISLTIVFLPFLDPVSGRLEVNITQFVIEKI